MKSESVPESVAFFTDITFRQDEILGAIYAQPVLEADRLTHRPMADFLVGTTIDQTLVRLVNHDTNAQCFCACFGIRMIWYIWLYQ